MQIIQVIRDKGAKIASALIAIAIIAFIIQDRSNSSKTQGSSTSMGKINGETVDAVEFNNKVKQVEEQYGSHANGMFFQIRQNVWDQVVQEDVLTTEFDKLGLTFSPRELQAIMFSDDAPPALKQSFTDKTTGQYDIAKAQEWWKTQAKKAKGDLRDKIEEGVIDPLVLRGLYTKYNALISSGGYYPTWMQEKESANAKTFANISYVAVPYNVINDSTVKVSDDDITAYVKAHAAAYKQDAGRVVSYVGFSQNPSGTDSSKIFEDVAKLKSSFVADTNAKKFVLNNMSAENFDDHYIYKSKLQMQQKDSVAALKVGEVYGPYLDNKNVVLAKMLASRELPDSVKCRHILIKIADQKGEIRADSTARKLIDSIADAIKGGADFNAMVLKYSDDDGSKATKGEYTFGNSSQLVDSFYRTVFYEPVGTKKIVKGESLQGEGAYIGYHYIEVLSQWKMEPAYQIAFMSKEIVASDETVNNAQQQATKLSGEATDEKSLDAYVAKNNLKKVSVPTVLKENDFQVGGLQDARQIVKWAFDAKEGNVSEPFTIGNQFVVAVVDKVVPEGLPDAAVARPMVEGKVRQQKKADIISDKIGKTPTLESATAAYGTPVQNAGADSSLTFSSPFINGVGQEPKVIGASFNKDYQGKVSPAIPGNNAVYVIKVNSVGTKGTDAPDVAAKQIAEHQKSMYQSAGSGWFNSLKAIADIKDSRSKFY